MLRYSNRAAVHAISQCTLRISAARWAYANAAADAIDAAWRDAQLSHPKYFNGAVYLVDSMSLDAGALHATLLQSDFKSYLYWRGEGYPAAGVRDGFGSALVRARDGAYLLGRQRAGNVNAGLAYMPSGFIDGGDVGRDGSIDIAASIVRELAEETGLTTTDVEIQPGFLVTEMGAQLSIAKTFQSPLDGEHLKIQVERHLADDPASELDGVVIVRQVEDLKGLPMPSYARLLLEHLLAPAGAGA